MKIKLISVLSKQSVMGVSLWGHQIMVRWFNLTRGSILVTYVKSTTLYLIKYFLLIQPNYNTQTLVNRISFNLTIEWNRMNRMPSIPPKRMPRMESNNRITIE